MSRFSFLMHSYFSFLFTCSLPQDCGKLVACCLWLVALAKEPAALFNGACSSSLDPRSLLKVHRVLPQLTQGSGLKFGQAPPARAEAIVISDLTPDPIHTTATCFLWIYPPNAEVLDQGSSLAKLWVGRPVKFQTPKLDPRSEFTYQLAVGQVNETLAISTCSDQGSRASDTSPYTSEDLTPLAERTREFLLIQFSLFLTQYRG